MQIRKIDQPVDRVQHVIRRHEFIESEFVEKCSPAFLRCASIAHHA